MSNDFNPSILIYGLNDKDVNNAKEQLKKWSFNFCSSLEIQQTEHLKEKIIGVLIISCKYTHPDEDLTLIYDLPNLKVVSCNSSGIDHLDVTTLNKKNVIIKNCPDETSDSTSDLGIIFILNMARKIVKAIEMVHTPSLHSSIVFDNIGMDVRGKTLGIVGLGKIGQTLAYKASLAFGMRIVYNQRNKRSDSTFPFYESLNEMLPVVDFLVLSCSLNSTTRHLIDLKRLKLMKPTAFLINISRGPIVKTNDLVEALRCGFIAGVGLDVTDPEPLPDAHPLLHMDNVLVLPHIGTFTVETESAMLTSSIDNLKDALETVSQF